MWLKRLSFIPFNHRYFVLSLLNNCWNCFLFPISLTSKYFLLGVLTNLWALLWYEPSLMGYILGESQTGIFCSTATWDPLPAFKSLMTCFPISVLSSQGPSDLWVFQLWAFVCMCIRKYSRFCSHPSALFSDIYTSCSLPVHQCYFLRGKFLRGNR